MSGFEFAASLVASLAWPSAFVIAVIVLRRPLSVAFGRVRRVEALGVSAELDAVEHAREGVEQELTNSESDLDAIVARATDYGWHLGRVAPDVPPGVQVDRSSETPTVHSAAEEVLKRHTARMHLDDNLFAWKQVADQLEKSIMTEQLKVGDSFPTAMEIASEYGVGLHTARKAIDALRRRGLIIAVDNGIFIAPRTPDLGPLPGPKPAP
ncbi:GntR family transcriptional regulator [Nonomuraea terrae]|uniref:GntR family transcriptional regulator n=1 Tax=Nonomuraea terrae TaxID=2530383 RepID=A0A4R4XKL9_9ACTN|nr:GntR family transcriptional regulator [Nonomuraea terrae]TDD31526.1 GntR family transcriptional regulator [Nonomuraea terrae]